MYANHTGHVVTNLKEKMIKKNKVIGIGFHKTGTSTLDSALVELGYKVLGTRIDLASNLFNEDFETVFKLTEKYDAFQDNPWPLLYKKFDKSIRKVNSCSD